jgi:hypothetical protein
MANPPVRRRRTRDYLDVGFWNIQQASALLDPNSTRPPTRVNVRTNFVFSKIAEWYLDPGFDLLILAEVADGETRGDVIRGSDLAGELARRLSNIAPRRDIRARYIWSEDNLGLPQVCNFIVVWNESEPSLVGTHDRMRFFWEKDWVRPMIIVQTLDVVVGGIHAKSRIRDRAENEIIGACHELRSYEQRAVLIGDMNIPFDSFPYFATLELRRSDAWQRIPPGLTYTYRSPWSTKYKPKILDYMFRNGGLSTADANAPFRNYQQWYMVDHAPIQYRVGWGVPAAHRGRIDLAGDLIPQNVLVVA